MKLRVASYNIHKCVGFDRRRDPARIIAVLNALDADIIALQEVDHRLGPRKAALPIAAIRHQTNFNIAPFVFDGPSLGWHGQTILIRKPYELVATRKLALPGLEPRGAVMADIVTRAGDIRIVGVHLGLVRRYRTKQLTEIQALLREQPAIPTVVLGDFNDWSADGGAAALLPDYRLHVPGKSFPAVRPMAALDRVAVGHGAHIVDAGVFNQIPARMASDHLPIWASIEIRP
jgi:endonuclease/exonuclease/phosphatase family metal-dependent hydrolase